MNAVRSGVAILAQPRLLWALLRLNEVKTISYFLAAGFLIVLWPLVAPRGFSFLYAIVVYFIGQSYYTSVLRARSALLQPYSTPCLRGKTAIVTGGNLGIGFETAKALATVHGAHVVVACRGEATGVNAIEDISRRFVAVNCSVVANSYLRILGAFLCCSCRCQWRLS
jgi:hypothetical protein